MKKSSVILLVSLLLLCICAMTFASCTASPSVTGTYYLYEDNATNRGSWVKLAENNRWSDSDGMSGRYTLEDSSIVFYVTLDGEEGELLRGTLEDGKLSVGSLGITIVYYLDGHAPDSSEDQDNSDKNNSENNGENNNANEGGEQIDHEALLADFTYEKDGDKYIITGVKKTDVKNLVVPDFVSEIKDSAFSECEALEHITVPFVGTSKDYNAGEIAEFAVIFKGETAMAEDEPNYGGGIHRPGDSVEGVGTYNSKYNYSSNLKSIVVTGDVASLPYIGSLEMLESIEFKGSLAGLPLSTFRSCYALKKAVLGTGMETIGDYAFEGCMALEEINLPDGLVSIGKGAFGSCESLKSIAFPETLTSLGEYALSHCAGISSLNIPTKLTSIGSNAFTGMDALQSITVAEGNTAYTSKGNCFIEISTKTLMIGFDNSVIPTDGSVMVIEGGAFSNRSGLKEVVIPQGVTTIGYGTFQYCTSLKSVVIPNSVTCIENNAFDNCTSLESIVIPDSVTDISSSVFNGCNSLVSLTVPFIGSSVDNYDNAYLGYFFGWSYDKVDNKSVPQSLAEVIITKDDNIAEDAFYGCSNIKKVVIGEGVTNIDGAAFYGCSAMTEISLPKSLTNIGRNVFRASTALVSIRFGGSSAEWNAVSKNWGWNDETGAYTVHCTDGDVAKS